MLTDLCIEPHVEWSVQNAKKRVTKSLAKAGKSKMLSPALSTWALDWTKPETLPSEYVNGTDVLLGSDLVYSEDLVVPLVDTCKRLCKIKTGVFLYVTANTDRAGMENFVTQMNSSFVLMPGFPKRATEEYLLNPLPEDQQNLFELHLSELRDVGHDMYKFTRR